MAAVSKRRPHRHRLVQEILTHCQDAKAKQDPEATIFQEALGAIANWRGSLQFLSRLVPHEQGELQLGPPKPEVIDTFFLHVVRPNGARPTLTHRMLVWLASTIRADIVLTTNFDELLEQAFRETGMPTTVFDVHISAGLPPQRVCEVQRSLIKLHGGRYGLRADYTLDDQALEADREQFVSYVAAAPTVRDLHHSENPTPVAPQRHLLVLGFSGRDGRILSLIDHAARRTSEPLKVFWVCHSKKDVEHVQRLAERSDTSLTFCRTPNLGLFLLEAYQAITKRLPASGLPFPSVSELPTAPNLPREESERDDVLERHVDALCGHMKTAKQQTHQARLVAVVGPWDSLDHFRVAQRAYHRILDGPDAVLWLDMDDVASVDDLLEKLLHAIARQSGAADWMPLPLKGSDEEKRELKHSVQMSQRDWTLFLNCSDGVGRTVPVSPTPAAQDEVNGWVEHGLPAPPDIAQKHREGQGSPARALNKTTALNELERTEPASEPDHYAVGPTTPSEVPDHEITASGPDFLRFLRQISKDVPGLTVVLIYNSKTRSGVSRFHASLHEREQPRTVDVESGSPIRDASPTTRNGVVTLVEKAITWAGSDIGRQTFLLAITSLRRVMYPALLRSAGCHVRLKRPDAENLIKRFELTKKYMKGLVRDEIAYLKPGGFAWMSLAVRQGIHDRLVKGALAEFKPAEILCQVHHQFAEWYLKLYAASGSWEAAFESIYHRCRNAEQMLILASDDSVTSNQPKRLRRAHESMVAVLALLDVVEPDLLVGPFSRAACRQLVFLRRVLLAHLRTATKARHLADTAEQPKLHELFRKIHYRSLLLNRTIAREVCEHEKAFERHNQIEQMEAPHRARHEGALWDPDHMNSKRELGVLAMCARSYERAWELFQDVCKGARLPGSVMGTLALPAVADERAQRGDQLSENGEDVLKELGNGPIPRKSRRSTSSSLLQRYADAFSC